MLLWMQGSTSNLMRFRDGNKIRYGQDSMQYRGIPSGVDFVVAPFSKDMFTLTAFGYGLLERGGYGNGQLFVWGLTKKQRQRFEEAL